MFGYWKRRALSIEAHRDMLALDRNAANRARNWLRSQLGTMTHERDVARDEARQLRSQLSAADLQIAAEKQDNEALRRKLKTTQAGLDHATHCYEQSELDRQALARERDEARAERARASKAYTSATRDLERIHLISFEHVTEGTFATPEPTETASAGPDPIDEPTHEANPAPHAPSEPGRCVVCHGGGCQWCLGREPREVGGFATIVANADDPLYPDGP